MSINENRSSGGPMGIEVCRALTSSTWKVWEWIRSAIYWCDSHFVENKKKYTYLKHWKNEKCGFLEKINFSEEVIKVRIRRIQKKMKNGGARAPIFYFSIVRSFSCLIILEKLNFPENQFFIFSCFRCFGNLPKWLSHWGDRQLNPGLISSKPYHIIISYMANFWHRSSDDLNDVSIDPAEDWSQVLWSRDHFPSREIIFNWFPRHNFEIAARGQPTTTFNRLTSKFRWLKRSFNPSSGRLITSLVI